MGTISQAPSSSPTVMHLRNDTIHCNDSSQAGSLHQCSSNWNLSHENNKYPWISIQILFIYVSHINIDKHHLYTILNVRDYLKGQFTKNVRQSGSISKHWLSLYYFFLFTTSYSMKKHEWASEGMLKETVP